MTNTWAPPTRQILIFWALVVRPRFRSKIPERVFFCTLQITNKVQIYEYEFTNIYFKSVNIIRTFVYLYGFVISRLL
jgi:hypothetical protein